MKVARAGSGSLRADLLVTCREAAGLTQGALAQAMSQRSGAAVSQGYVSKVESSSLAVTPDRVALFAEVLGVTEDLLLDPQAQIWSLGEGCDYQRKRASTSVRSMRRLHATLNLIRVAIERSVPPELGIGPGFSVPRVAVGGMTSAADLARDLRRQLDVPAGPIGSVIALTEKAGAWVVLVSIGGREVDAVSLHPYGGVPLFAVNSDAPADRLRFTLAHELGHAVSTTAVGDEERSADQFAAELLTPSKDILPELQERPMTLQRLRELKRRWRVSAAALARRSHDLGVITDNAYRSLTIEMSGLGWKRAEPDAFAPERPEAVPALIRAGIAEVGSLDALTQLSGLSPERFSDWFSASLPSTDDEGAL